MDYIEKFELLSATLDSCEEEMLKAAFMNGLKREVKADLRLMKLGNLAEIMDRIDAVIRDRVRIQGEVRTHTAQGRMTGWILCLLPPVLLLFINLVSPGYSKVLLHDPVGQKLLYAGIAFLLVGALTIRNIVRGIEV